jgi:hypothetical protein
MTLSFFLDLEMVEDESFEEDDMEEDMEEGFQNAYWISDNAGKMVRQRVACGIYRMSGSLRFYQCSSCCMIWPFFSLPLFVVLLPKCS